MEVTDYVKCTRGRYDRSMNAKFCCGILQLHVETGRLKKRKCVMCNMEAVEDEFIFSAFACTTMKCVYCCIMI